MFVLLLFFLNDKETKIAQQTTTTKKETKRKTNYLPTKKEVKSKETNCKQNRMKRSGVENPPGSFLLSTVQHFGLQKGVNKICLSVSY